MLLPINEPAISKYHKVLLLVGQEGYIHGGR